MENVLDKVAIVIAYEKETIDEELVRQVHYGIEEESIPYILLASEKNDEIELSELAANSSKLGVGIGLARKKYGCIKQKNFKPGEVLFHGEIDSRYETARNLGTNGARLIKGMAFKVQGQVK